MNFSSIRFNLLSAVLAFCVTLTAAGQVVPLSKVPAVVQKTIHATLIGAKLGEIERIEENGEVAFDVEMTRGDVERSFTVAEDGTLLSIEVFLAETPAAAQPTITKTVGTGELDGN